jgi:hypothetical protein
VGGKNMAGGAGGEEAAWRELIAHYTAPSAADEGQTPWPDRENLATTGPTGPAPDPGPDTDPTLGTALGTALGPDLAEDTDPGLGIDLGPDLGARVIRPARQAPPPQGDDGDHFIPPPPPPLPTLDPVTKGAWVALFGGPGYLFVAIMLGWSVPGWAAFCAVAAFVGGFATLVVRMGDRPPRDSGPDDGAVV